MSIDKNMVKRLATLSRLEIPEDNLDNMVNEITKIIGWVDQLQAVDTTNVFQMNSVVENMDIPQRDDVVTDGNIRDAVFSNAPDQMDGYFLVPKMVE